MQREDTDLEEKIFQHCQMKSKQDKKEQIHDRKMETKQNVKPIHSGKSYPIPETSKQQFEGSRNETKETNGRIGNICDEEIDLEEIDDFLDAFHISKPKRRKQDGKSKNITKLSTSEGTDFNMNLPKQPNMEDSDFEDTPKKSSKVDLKHMNDSQTECNTEVKMEMLRYKLLNKQREYPLEVDNERIKCPICGIKIKTF